MVIKIQTSPDQLYAFSTLRQSKSFGSWENLARGYARRHRDVVYIFIRDLS